MKTILTLGIKLLFSFMLTTLLFVSCKKDEKETQIESIPGFSVNTSIAKLIESGSNITTESVVWGFINAAGSSQNAPNMVWLQDDQSGLALKIEETALTNFKEGSLVFIRAKGLSIKKEGSFWTMGIAEGNTLRALNSKDVETHIGLGAKNQKVTTQEFSVAQLDVAHQQMLVKVKDVEVTSEYLNGTYGPSGNELEKEVILQDCSGSEITLITNKNADLATVNILAGRGDLTGVFSMNNGRKELRLIHKTDADGLTAVRCAGSGDITLTRAINGIIAQGAGATIPAGTEIKVVNISSSISETGGGITVQDASGGIFISGVTTASYPLGAALIINVGGKQTALVNGRFTITGVTAGNIQNAGTYQYPAKIVTVNNMITDNTNQTLVQLNNLQVLLYDSFTNEKVYRLRDNSGRINLNVVNASGINLTEGTASVTGYFITKNGEPQFLIRKQDDVIYGGTAPNKDPDFIVETFETASVKGQYPLGNVTAPSGVWIFDQVLVYGLEPKDWRPMSPRMVGINNRDAAIPGPGFIQSRFDINGLKRIRVEFVSHNDPLDIGPVFRVEVQISTNNGTTWTSLGTKDTGKSQIETADFSPNIAASEKVLVKIINRSPQPPGVTTQLFRGNRVNLLKVTLEQK